jgi:hypothetical protein
VTRQAYKIASFAPAVVMAAAGAALITLGHLLSEVDDLADLPDE